MRHRVRTAKLGRTGEHRNAMLANMVCSLIEKKEITTTLAKAKAGSNNPARMAMMAITTNSSMSVKPSDTRKPDAMGAGLVLRVVGVLPIKLLSLKVKPPF